LHNSKHDTFGESIFLLKIYENHRSDEGQSYKEVIENQTKTKGFRDFSSPKVSFFFVAALPRVKFNQNSANWFSSSH
jgi:hypothetical protein